MNNLYKLNKLISKKTIAFLHVLVLIVLKSNAQIIPSTPMIENTLEVANDLFKNKVNIEFSAKQEIYNLLVLITDEHGKTIFLDNRYHFTGNYNKSIDFKSYDKGVYLVKIISDHENVTKKIDINK